ncbi:TIGR03758 family integrating conjugative element protein [Klebsiella pneumoniae]
MAMNSQQKTGWSAGTGSSLTPEQLNVLILGVLAVVIFLFSAWALVQAYRGLITQSVTMRQLTEQVVRLVLLILITLFFFFN